MADIYTDRTDEQIIDDVLRSGFDTKDAPKYRVLRLALARSLQISSPPDGHFDKIGDKGSEYKLNQVTGKEGEKDYDDAVRALLSVYHDSDLFADEKMYRRYLQRHIRRGLYEIRTSWNRNHDFTGYLQQELLVGVDREMRPENIVSDDQLLAALREIGIEAELRQREEGSRLSRCSLYLPDIKQYDLLKRGLEKLAMLLGLGGRGLLLQAGKEPKVVSLDIPRQPESWKMVTSSPLWAWLDGLKEQGERDMLLPVWLGQDVVGHDFAMDLAQAPHLLVCGTTGSGKSVCLHSIITSLVATVPTNNLRLALIDPKRVEFSRYDKLANIFGEEIVNSADQAMLLLDSLVEEMEERHVLMQEAGVTSVAEGNEKKLLELPFIVVLVEELADLLMQSRELEVPLVRLAQKARAAGIHLVLATQRPDSEILTGLLRSNIPGRIALRVQKMTESKIILDEKGAESLLGKGDMLVKVPPYNEPVRVHGAHITAEDLNVAIGRAV